MRRSKQTLATAMSRRVDSNVEQELAWREFYRQALFHFPELADGPYRPSEFFPGRTTPSSISPGAMG